MVRGSESRAGLVDWSKELTEEGRTLYTVRLEWDGETVSGAAGDMFEALVEIRRQVEPKGWLMAIQGSRLDAYPSGMARDMGGGEKIYVLRPGQPALLADLVDTLADASIDDLATVGEQIKFFESWEKL
ncbi:hypothetical protein [Amycolatopsis sp. WGS_07]|uniref:hypothetical protein n=1 Tax=Amycolatopsis sp. WGS_07 TaxID=3076764 RepID=UPI0038730E93